jgi:hypothetical protein
MPISSLIGRHPPNGPPTRIRRSGRAMVMAALPVLGTHHTGSLSASLLGDRARLTSFRVIVPALLLPRCPTSLVVPTDAARSPCPQTPGVWATSTKRHPRRRYTTTLATLKCGLLREREAKEPERRSARLESHPKSWSGPLPGRGLLIVLRPSHG